MRELQPSVNVRASPYRIARGGYALGNRPADSKATRSRHESPANIKTDADMWNSFGRLLKVASVTTGCSPLRREDHPTSPRLVAVAHAQLQFVLPRTNLNYSVQNKSLSQ